MSSRCICMCSAFTMLGPVIQALILRSWHSLLTQTCYVHNIPLIAAVWGPPLCCTHATPASNCPCLTLLSGCSLELFHYAAWFNITASAWGWCALCFVLHSRCCWYILFPSNCMLCLGLVWFTHITTTSQLQSLSVFAISLFSSFGSSQPDLPRCQFF